MSLACSLSVTEVAGMEPGPDGFIDLGILEPVSAPAPHGGDEGEFPSLDGSDTGQVTYAPAVPSGRLALQVREAIQAALVLPADSSADPDDSASLLDLMGSDEPSVVDHASVLGDVLAEGEETCVEAIADIPGMASRALGDDLADGMAIAELLKAVDEPVDAAGLSSVRMAQYALQARGSAPYPLVDTAPAAAGLFADATLFEADAASGAGIAPSPTPSSPLAKARRGCDVDQQLRSTSTARSPPAPRRRVRPGDVVSSSIEQLLQPAPLRSRDQPATGAPADGDATSVAALVGAQAAALNSAATAEEAATSPMVAQAWRLITSEWGIEAAPPSEAAEEASSAPAPAAAASCAGLAPPHTSCGDEALLPSSAGFLDTLHEPDETRPPGAWASDCSAKIKHQAGEALSDTIASDAMAALDAIRAQFAGQRP